MKPIVLNVSCVDIGRACYIMSRSLSCRYTLESMSLKDDKFTATIVDSTNSNRLQLQFDVLGNRMINGIKCPVLTPTPKKTRTRKPKEVVA